MHSSSFCILLLDELLWLSCLGENIWSSYLFKGMHYVLCQPFPYCWVAFSILINRRVLYFFTEQSWKQRGGLQPWSRGTLDMWNETGIKHERPHPTSGKGSEHPCRYAAGPSWAWEGRLSPDDSDSSKKPGDDFETHREKPESWRLLF